MRFLRQLFLHVALSSLLLYVFVTYVPELGLLVQSEYKGIFVVYLVLGVLFWFVQTILKSVLSLLTLPVRLVTLGLFSLVLNFALLYVFAEIVNWLDLGIIVILGSIVQVFILSCCLSLLSFLIKKI